jgi:hypothetical protein
MGIHLSDLNDKQKSLIADRPRTKAWRTLGEAETQRQKRCELEMHNQFWSFLRRHGFEDVEYSNPHRKTRARQGRPDFLICRDSHRLGIEFKLPGNKLSPEQETFFQMAERQGNLCLVCFSYREAINAVTVFFSRSPPEDPPGGPLD